MEAESGRELRYVRARACDNIDPELYKATIEGDLSCLERLIESQPDILMPTNLQKQKTVIHLVASSATVPVLKLIRDKCPQLIKKKSFKDDTLLHVAARAGKVDILSFLISWAEAISAEEKEEESDIYYVLLREINEEGNTPLHEAVRGQHTGLANELLNKDPHSAGIINNRGESPLYLAAGRSSPSWKDVVEKILRLASSESISEGIFGGPNGRTPLHSAVASGTPCCVNLLVQQRKELINKGDDDGRTPLHYAAFFGDSCNARVLLVGDTSCAFQHDNQGLYPIHLAVAEGHIEMIQKLLKHCPNSRLLVNQKGQNALHVAAMKGHGKLVTYLLNSMPEMLINEKDEDGNTPLHLATINSHPKVVSILTDDKRVDMSVMNNEDLTARDIAKKYTNGPISLPKVLALVALKIACAPLGRSRVVIANNEPRTAQIMRQEKNEYEKMFNTLVLVATLIATITFAAGFTFPGGYNSTDGPYQGMPIILKKQAFHVFVFCNTVAMYLSILVVVNHIAAQLGDVRLWTLAFYYSLLLLIVSLVMMALAFTAGMYLVVVKLRWIIVVVLVMLIFFFLHILVLTTILVLPVLSKYPALWFISKFAFNFLISIYNFFELWTDE